MAATNNQYEIVINTPKPTTKLNLDINDTQLILSVIDTSISTKEENGYNVNVEKSEKMTYVFDVMITKTPTDEDNEKVKTMVEKVRTMVDDAVYSNMSKLYHSVDNKLLLTQIDDMIDDNSNSELSIKNKHLAKWVGVIKHINKPIDGTHILELFMRNNIISVTKMTIINFHDLLVLIRKLQEKLQENPESTQIYPIALIIDIVEIFKRSIKNKTACMFDTNMTLIQIYYYVSNIPQVIPE